MNHLEETKLLRQEPGGRHYNCAQSLLVPFAAEIGMEKEAADALGAFFGAYGTTDCRCLLAATEEKGVTRKENCDGLVFDMCQKLATLLTETK